MSEQQNCTIPAGGVTFTIKRVFALIATVALLIAIVAVQVSPRDASADEVQESQGRTPVETPERASAGLPNRATSPWVPVDGADTLSEAPAAESRIIDSTSGLNTPELQTSAQQAGRLPQEYEDALANWPEDEANGFREYYLENPDELTFIEVDRLIRQNGTVNRSFSVRAATTNRAGSAEPVQCGSKVALILDASSSIDASEMEQMKQAAKQVVDNFAGTPTELGIYNFATNSPTRGTLPLQNAEMSPRSMLEESAVTAARDAIKQLTYAGGMNDLERETNWEAGLKRAVGQGYDAVLFVTDGKPTAPTDTGDTLGSALYEGIEKAQKVARQLRNENVNIIGLFVGENKESGVVTKFCQTARFQEKYNGAECERMEKRRPGSSLLPVDAVPLPYIPDGEIIDGVSAQQVKMHRKKGGFGDTNNLSFDSPLSASDAAKTKCTDKYWTDGGRKYRSLFSCPIGGSDRDFAATKITAFPKDILDSVASSTIMVNDYSALQKELDSLTSSCKGTVQIEKEMVDENGNKTSESPEGWEFIASKSIEESGGTATIVNDKKYRTDAQGRTVIRIATTKATNVSAGNTKIEELQKPGYVLRPQNGKTAECRIVDGQGNLVNNLHYDNIDAVSGISPAEPFSFNLKNIGADYKINCKVQNMRVQVPDISFAKMVRSQEAEAADANSKNEAYDLGNSNEYPNFTVDYKLTNNGDVPVGYFELVDKQLEVPISESELTLEGLSCGESNSVTLSDDKKTARVTLANPLNRGGSVTCTQSRAIVDLKFQNTDNPDAPIKYFGNEATVTAKKSAGDSGAATVSDNAWVKASPNLTLFKTFQGGPTRVVTGPVGQQFNTEYTVVLTNSGYVDGKVPELTDTPRTAHGLKVIDMTAFNSPISNTGNLDAQNELIVGDQPVSLVDIDGDGLNWRLADDKLRVLKARHKGNFQIKVTYEVTEALQGADADSYICEKSRSKNNVGRGVNNTISAKQGNGIAEVRNANNAHVCISIQRADAAVTKKINDQGTPVNPSQSVDDQKSAKTISIPQGASEFKVSYVIRNNSVRGPKYLNDPTSELPRGAIVSAKVTDYVLDSAGNRTTKKVPVKNLSCSGENTQTIGTYDAASGVVTFNPPLAKAEEVTCSGTVSTAELDADDIVDGIHGDEVVVVPSYEVDSDQELDGSSEAVGSPISDKAWLKLPATFTMSKNAVSDTVVARGRKGDTFTAAYNVTVKNTSVVAGTPESIIESPAPISGVKAIKVVARNTDGSNTRLLSSSSDVTLQDNSDGTFTLNKSELAAIPGNSNANGDSQATIDVLVTYQITSEDGLSATSEYLECRASDNGRGLRNRVYFLSEPDNDADACISLAIPRIELEKLINGEKADDRDHATAILPGAKDVEIAYAVTNLGKPDIEWFTIGDRYGEEAQSGRSLSIMGLQCDRNVDIATSGSSSVKVTPAAPLTQGQTITCSWRIENGERMRYNSDGYHVNTATVNASFMQSNSQSTNPDIISSDRAWAVQLPALDGLLPKSGGFGVAPYGLGALILFAGAFFINRRGRKV
ncbi:VWA domain-containing protein [Corynebacterium sp. P5848]|uniref:vWA domain-containing protein n=1 Tax=Corynebacterium marambiense TaxID=2765364 RepID=UPI002260FF26|nr:vWA domain-containing protein [Corynebacterium marambiense]MCX7541774.1 VWA domain-containing protein [Corynebacterium marambiense]